MGIPPYLLPVLVCWLSVKAAGLGPTPLSTRIISPLRPTSYDIKVQPYYPAAPSVPPGRMFTFDGSITIQFRATAAADNITLNAVNLNITQSSVLLVATNQATYKLQTMVYLPNVQQVVLIFDRPLSGIPTIGYTLQMTYKGLINTPEGRGLFKATYQENGQTKYILGTHFEPTRCRKFIPSWDDPGLKAMFKVKVVHPTGTTALSNDKQLSTKDLGNNWSLTEFQVTPKMSSYLLAIIIGDIVSVSTQDHYGTLVRVWTWKEMAPYLPWVLDKANRTLQFFGDYFDRPFPLPKCDLIALPEFGPGAMENWGLLIFDYRDMFFKASVQRPFKGLDNTLTIAHELAHQWFGDLVTTRWWSDLFLNEGFAQYWMYLGAEHLVPQQTPALTEYFEVNEESFAMEADQDPTYSHAIVWPLGPGFDRITYMKGASMLRMINYTIGSKNLEQGLKNYLYAHQYRNADHNDLWKSLTPQATNTKDWNNQPLNIASLMNPWVLQADFPLLTVTRSFQGGYLQITQSPFSLPARNGSNASWYVPVWYRSASSRMDSFTWLQPNKTTKIPGIKPYDWVILNPEMRVFCRVNYDSVTWRMITEQLVRDPMVFDVGTRVQLVLDARYLSIKGSHSYALFTSLTQYLRKETEYGPWKSAASEFTRILNMFASQSSTLTPFREYVLSLVAPVYLNWTPSTLVSKSSLLGLLTTWACQLNLPTCVNQASDSFHQILTQCQQSTNGTSWCTKINPELRKTVYCTGIHWATSGPNWTTLLNLYLEEQKNQPYWGDEADNLLFGLTCTRNPVALKNFLNKTITGQIPDSERALQYLGQNTGYFGSNIMWNFLSSNLQAIVKSGSLHQYLNAMVTTWNSDSHITRLTSLQTKIPSNAQNILTAAIAKVQSHQLWLQTNMKTIHDWLIINSL